MVAHESSEFDILVMGHLCVDLIPSMDHVPPQALIQPGRLYEVQELQVSTGGAVSNTGMALHRLGVDVRLMSLVGDDAIGGMIVEFLAARDPALAEHITVLPGVASSYTIVLSPERSDRIFLHCAGTNDQFGAEYVDLDIAARAIIVHLGYPPLLPRLYSDEGGEILKILRPLRERGVITSLDMAMPDAHGNSGRAKWYEILRNTLPYVDIFVPSFDEILYMMRPDDFRKYGDHPELLITEKYVAELTAEMLSLGCKIAGVKLGVDGIWLQTGNREAIDTLREALPLNEAWNDCSAWHPAFEVELVGTTGAGDSAYAGLLAAILNGMSPAETVRMASAVGACNVEAADAVSSVRTWEDTRKRLAAGWRTKPSRLAEHG